MSPSSVSSSGNRSGNSWRLAVAFLIVALAGVAYCMFMQKTVAPNVIFTGLNGEKVSLNSLHGKVVLVNFWATSCPICVHEMPAMVKTYNQFKGKGLEFVAVAMSYDQPNYVLNYAQTRHLPFIVALDPQDELAHAFGDVKATPTTFLIGKDGNIIKRYVGEPEFGALDQMLEKALALALPS
jgi:peroxiredoxin